MSWPCCLVLCSPAADRAGPDFVEQVSSDVLAPLALSRLRAAMFAICSKCFLYAMEHIAVLRKQLNRTRSGGTEQLA